MTNKKPGHSKKPFNAIKEFLSPLQSSERKKKGLFDGPNLELYSIQRWMPDMFIKAVSRNALDLPIPSDDQVDKINRDRIEQAKIAQTYEQLDQSSEALNLNLKSQHRLLIATLLTSSVALISALTAMVISLNTKPPIVNIQPPIVNVQPPDVTVKPSIIVEADQPQ